MPSPVSIVVPTFREAANIPVLVSRIHAALSDKGIDWELVLVDDDSKDGSEAVVAELGRRFPVRMHTRRGAPRDLSLSVLLGFRLARFERLVVMDADLSHPPARILDLLADLGGDCDLVVGSRYAPGGRIDGPWSRSRRLTSRLATWLARPLTDCTDPLSGFFAIDRRVLPAPARLHAVGAAGRMVATKCPDPAGARSAGGGQLRPGVVGRLRLGDRVFTQESVIRDPSGLWRIWFSPGDIKNEGHYWPIVYTSFWLEHKLWGLAPAGYHTVNVLLHAVNVLLLWRLLLCLPVPGAAGGRRPSAARACCRNRSWSPCRRRC